MSLPSLLQQGPLKCGCVLRLSCQVAHQKHHVVPVSAMSQTATLGIAATPGVQRVQPCTHPGAAAFSSAAALCLSNSWGLMLQVSSTCSSMVASRVLKTLQWAALATEVSYQHSHIVQLCVLLWRGAQELPPDCLAACIAQKVYQHRVHALGHRAACMTGALRWLQTDSRIQGDCND